MSTLLEQILPMPKIITPRKHQALDYMTAGVFLLAAGSWWKRRRRPAIAALVNGVYVLSYALLTDYDGSRRQPVSFKRHGELDRIQAALAAAIPDVLEFGRKPEAGFFRTQALMETIVLTMTDFNGPAQPDVTPEENKRVSKSLSKGPKPGGGKAARTRSSSRSTARRGS